ncbi:MAG: J domain-containing protein [Novosphingobium sp.]|uniref:J domain-containing protein n=1 Tax=Novosphingobium sp. TaxID=1874826 RepID=UPI003B9BE074
MKRVRTHYDNLQVARNADPSVIAAAYRSLSFKHHPDRTKGGGRSEDIMRILNQSYAVLSDPTQRLAHDQWIEKMEAKGRAGQQDIPPSSQARAGAGQQPDEDAASGISRPMAKMAEFAKRAKVPLVILGIASIAAFVFSEPQPSGLPRYEAAGPANGAEAADDPLEAGATGNDLPISSGGTRRRGLDRRS